jgi:hypothetical protein
LSLSGVISPQPEIRAATSDSATRLTAVSPSILPYRVPFPQFRGEKKKKQRRKKKLKKIFCLTILIIDFWSPYDAF